jgi:hypothetical protein
MPLAGGVIDLRDGSVAADPGFCVTHCHTLLDLSDRQAISMLRKATTTEMPKESTADTAWIDLPVANVTANPFIPIPHDKSYGFCGFQKVLTLIVWLNLH